MDANLAESRETVDGAEVSGRWIRDRFREVNDGPADAAPAAAAESDESTPDLAASIAASVSDAVARPLRDLESRRAAERTAIERTLQDHSRHLTETTESVARLSGDLGRLDEALRGARTEIRTEIEDRVSGIDVRGISDGVNTVRSQVQTLEERLARLESDGRTREQRLEQLLQADARRTQALRRLGELLQDVREAVRALEGAVEQPAGDQQEPTESAEER